MGTGTLELTSLNLWIFWLHSFWGGVYGACIWLPVSLLLKYGSSLWSFTNDDVHENVCNFPLSIMTCFGCLPESSGEGLGRSSVRKRVYAANGRTEAGIWGMVASRVGGIDISSR